MTETQRSGSDFELVWQAAARLLPAARSPLFQTGLTGEMFRGSNPPLLASDLTHLLIPGLNALGVRSRLESLPPNGAYPERRHDASGACLLLDFSGSLEFAPPDEINDSTPLPPDGEPRIIAQSPFLERRADASVPEIADSSVLSEASARPRFSHLLHLAKTRPVPLRESVPAVVHRWLGRHAAYPEHAPREGDRADLRCGPAAAFLSEAIGTRRDFISNRLRYAARCWDSAQIECAYRWLLEAGIAVWQLSAAPAEALLTPSDRPLSDMLRRELIYLARAGTLPLKTVAARRLTHERHHPDARKTLHQLCFDPDPWVRAAARPSSA